jgi:hypothetical protein
MFVWATISFPVKNDSAARTASLNKGFFVFILLNLRFYEANLEQKRKASIKAK